MLFKIIYLYTHSNYTFKNTPKCKIFLFPHCTILSFFLFITILYLDVFLDVQFKCIQIYIFLKLLLLKSVVVFLIDPNEQKKKSVVLYYKAIYQLVYEEIARDLGYCESPLKI